MDTATLKNRLPFRWGLRVLATTLCALLAGLLPPHAATAGISNQEGVNLLVNGGFEYPYNEDFRGDGGGFIAHGWSAWWYNDPGSEYDAPEYKTATLEQDPYRVRDGIAAQQYFRPWARHLAGLYQRVQVPPNSHVRFTVWGHAWSTFCEIDQHGNEDCDPRNSFHGQVNPIDMKVGIDPTGGTDAFSAAIVWSAVKGVYDNYEQFAVEADAQGDYVTVFIYSTPEWPSAVINVYWDSAVLTAIGGSSAPPPTSPPATRPPVSGSNPTSQAQPAPTVTPSPTTTTTPTITPTATPQTVAEAPIMGQICLSLFEDANENGLRDLNEPLLPGGTLNIEGLTSTTHTTDGISEPFCFEGLQPGDYHVAAGPPEGYHLTGLEGVPVTLSEGGAISLSFGAAVGAGEPPTEERAEPGVFPRWLAVAGIAGMLTLTTLGGLAVYLFISRRKA